MKVITLSSASAVCLAQYKRPEILHPTAWDTLAAGPRRLELNISPNTLDT